MLINSFKFAWYQLSKCQSCHHIETSQLICSANQLTGFYMMTTLVFYELKVKFGDNPLAIQIDKIKTWHFRLSYDFFFL